MTDTPEKLTDEEVTALIVAKVAELGDVEKAAAHWGVTKQMVYMVRTGDRRPSEKMLADIGVKSVSVPASQHYERIVPEAENAD